MTLGCPAGSGIQITTTHVPLCSLPGWVAWGQQPSPGNGAPQLKHLGHFREHSGTLGRDAARLPHGVWCAKGFLYPHRFYWIMTWILCRRYLETFSNDNKTLPRTQIPRRGKASSACVLQQRWGLSFIMSNSAAWRFSFNTSTLRTK